MKVKELPAKLVNNSAKMGLREMGLEETNERKRKLLHQSEQQLNQLGKIQLEVRKGSTLKCLRALLTWETL